MTGGAWQGSRERTWLKAVCVPCVVVITHFFSLEKKTYELVYKDVYDVALMPS